MNRVARLIPLLMLAVAFLGWETYQAWIAPPATALPAAGVAKQGAVSGGDNTAEHHAAAELAAAVSAITARPLLRPDRQPFKEILFVTAPPQRNYEGELARFSVIGILPIDGVEKALVVRKAGGSGSERWELAAGDSLPGFVVKGIRQDGVALVADGKEFLLPLYAGGPRQAGGGTMRTETAPAGMPQGVLPQGAPPSASFPKGVLPTMPQSVPAPQLAPGNQAVPGGGATIPSYRLRTRRPPVMPSRPLGVEPES